jgi:hypothetical protein
VTFHGRFDNGRLSEVYADLDALVVPSLWYENSPITIHEAFLTGTPVLASDRGGMAEFVRDGVDGLLFELGSAADLADKMAMMVEDAELRERLATAEWIPIKTIVENGEETEARYRSLCTVERDVGEATQGPAMIRGALDTAARRGACEQQAADMLLMRPGAEADWDLEGVPAGEYTLTVRMEYFAPEDAIVLAGEVVVDGVRAAEMAPTRSEGRTEAREQSLILRVEHGAKFLSLRASTEGAGDVYLRLSRLSLTRTEDAGQSSRGEEKC